MLISILVKVILIRLSGAFDTETSGFDTGAIDVKVDGFVLKKKLFLRYQGCLSLLNWIAAVALSLLIKLPSRKWYL